MCFSATASFTAAALTGAAGLVALSQVRRRRDVLLAATPLLFALQQGVEGLLWLRLPQGAAGVLPLVYLLFAEPLWPAYAPMAAWLAEPGPRRRRLMFPWVLVGAGAGAWLLWDVLAHPPVAAIQACHMVYVAGGPVSPIVKAAYLGAATLPLLISSAWAVRALGVIVLAGAAAAYMFYLAAFLSVWCFFAALASAILAAHFILARGRATSAAGAPGLARG